MLGFNKNQGLVPIFGFIQYIMYKIAIFNFGFMNLPQVLHLTLPPHQKFLQPHPILRPPKIIEKYFPS